MSAVLVVLLALLGALLSLALLLLLWVLQVLFTKEAEAALRALVVDLLQRTEQRLPSSQQPRFTEETKSGLVASTKERPLWTLIQAVSLYCSASSGRLQKEFNRAEARRQKASETSKALAHPIRLRILEQLEPGQASIIELARELEVRCLEVAYHVRSLERVGLIEVARTEQSRGFVRYFYRRAPRSPWGH